jgi:hypothetical protein
MKKEMRTLNLCLHDYADRSALLGFPWGIDRIPSTHLPEEILKYLRDMPVAFGRCFVEG